VYKLQTKSHGKDAPKPETRLTETGKKLLKNFIFKKKWKNAKQQMLLCEWEIVGQVCVYKMPEVSGNWRKIKAYCEKTSIYCSDHAKWRSTLNNYEMVSSSLMVVSGLKPSFELRPDCESVPCDINVSSLWNYKRRRSVVNRQQTFKEFKYQPWSPYR